MSNYSASQMFPQEENSHAPSLGHNGFIEPRNWAWQAAESDAHAYIKLIIHTLELLVKDGEQAALVSDERLAQLTSLSVKTVKKYRRDAIDDGWFSISVGNGRGMVTEYRMSFPLRTIQEIAAGLEILAKGYPERGTFPLEKGTPAGTPLEKRVPQQVPLCGKKGTLERIPLEESPPRKGTLFEPVLKKEIPPTPPKEKIINNIPPLIPPEPKPAKPRAGRGAKARLAVDWSLPDDWRARTKAKFGATDAQIEREAERFKRYWTSPDAKNPMKADWLATWENWFDRALERGIRTNGVNGHGYHANGSYSGKLI